MIRVGRIRNCNDRSLNHFQDVDGTLFTPVVVMTKSSRYGALSPYALHDEKNRLMENIWQFSKVYRTVPKSTQYYSQWDRTVIWDHPAETHVELGPDGIERLTKEYYQWREKGMTNSYPVRYPVGTAHRHQCIGSLVDGDDSTSPHLIGYVEARKTIYLPTYVDMVRDQPLFQQLLKRIRQGENLLILEVDGPHQESLDYYKKTYSVGDDFLYKGTMLCTPENLDIMLNDPKHNFGHGYCLAWALLDSGR